MQITDPLYTASMTEQQRSWFYAEYERAHKDEVIGFLLALFLGDFGIHQFYLRRNTAGILYLIFFWTGIPAILGFIECFFMPGRVRQYNAAQAAYIANQILAHSNPYTESTVAISHCPSCNSSIDPSASFCTHCGTAITHNQLTSQAAAL
jgi:TM2 domain-containing membrane protein YozV